MGKLIWDAVGTRDYETGVSHGVLYLPDGAGNYPMGVSWSGLTTVTESPSGAESNKQYADNIAYLDLYSAELFGGTIEAFTTPPEFDQFDGQGKPTAGISVGQQPRRPFGFCYQTLIGDDVQDTDKGYKIHVVYGVKVSPTERAYSTVNDSPEALTFSWAFTTSPVPVPGYKPSATLVLDSTKEDPATMAALELILYGDTGVDPRLPLPAEIITMFTSGVTVVTPTQPAFDSGTNTITIPTVTGVEYRVNGVAVPSGALEITEDTIVTAVPTAGYVFTMGIDDDWFYDFTE